MYINKGAILASLVLGDSLSNPNLIPRALSLGGERDPGNEVA